MKHTPTYNLTQWDLTDRILMQDFNDNNAIIDAALSRKLELVELANESAVLTDAPHFKVELTGIQPKDCVAILLYIYIPNIVQHALRVGSVMNQPVITLTHPSAYLLLPFRNPSLSLNFLPVSGSYAIPTASIMAQDLTSMYITYNSGAKLTGKYAVQVLGIL